jgi:hypothetical protein
MYGRSRHCCRLVNADSKRVGVLVDETIDSGLKNTTGEASCSVQVTAVSIDAVVADSRRVRV